jgi:mannose-6-phosphate isomerase-like protein (cupin superfamily)
LIRTGDTVVNPVTGEQLTFLKTARDTDGEAVVVECIVQPGGFVASAHFHPYQTERFQVRSGRLGVTAGRLQLELGPGEEVTVDPGTPHRFWNAGSEPVTFVATITPALEFERLIETMYGLAADGKTNRRGMPSPLRLAVIAQAHFDDVRLPLVPVWMQRAGLALGAPLGRALGYRPDYVPAGAPVPAGA